MAHGKELVNGHWIFLTHLYPKNVARYKWSNWVGAMAQALKEMHYRFLGLMYVEGEAYYGGIYRARQGLPMSKTWAMVQHQVMEASEKL